MRKNKVLTTGVKQRQRLRQREGLEERSAVAEVVEHTVYRAQFTGRAAHTHTQPLPRG